MKNLTDDEVAAVTAMSDYARDMLLHYLMGYAPDEVRQWMVERRPIVEARETAAS